MGQPSIPGPPRSLVGLSRWAIVSMIATTVLAAFATIALVGSYLSEQLWPAVAGLALFVLSGLAYIAAAVFFICWVYRARQNLGIWGTPGLRWEPVWSAVSWIIPLANLVIPGLVVSEIDKHSSGTAARSIWPWWVFFVLSSPFCSFSVSGDSDVLTIIFAVWLGFKAIAAIVALILAISLVRRITRAQESRLTQ